MANKKSAKKRGAAAKKNGESLQKAVKQSAPPGSNAGSEGSTIAGVKGVIPCAKQ